ncbi:tubulin-like doman-containing protein [Sphaerisporangium corydalis]|uniref:Tubulin-like doman-containing protein n=1 Tax=Sphaerisporangium corydalis TaxID=1441875 RepID=A0ABV9EQW7_9ACTN|nr:tubulin-like doman-containing protein [Sphaerisporangium corydalis]
MKLYQPVLFVGLGGTGCAIGAELERRLREEICGPDGSLFQRKREDAMRYQLPACLQFMYADVNQAELDRMPLNVVPGAQHVRAAQLTAHYVRDLVPQVQSYPQVAVNLRLAAGPAVQRWLPPSDGEPQVLPLYKGAGQMPTVGRSALFETFRSGIGPAIRDLDKAIGNLSGNQAATDLYKLADTGSVINPRVVDVFMAFSIAGGTGAGIFYDYFHLISRQFQNTDLQLKIYPLVLMPSAFEEGQGGGRAAELNAGRALLDLFQLVDRQNSPTAVRHLSGLEGGPVDPEEVAVRYPVEGRIAMRPGIVQTAFLFSRPTGARPSDLRRSVVSLIMSLVGTELTHNAGNDGEQHQSFADSFINSAVHRQIPAENGIGNRGVSTALVTSLTTPVEELADVVASRLIRVGIEELREPDPVNESSRKLIEEFFTLSGIGRLFTRQQVEFNEPEPATGAREVSATLSDRMALMRASLAALRSDLDQAIPAMVSQFDPGGAVSTMLSRTDPFRVRRVVFGHNSLKDPSDQQGAAGLMERRMESPPPPEGVQETPPSLPALRDRLGVFRVRWTDEDPTNARHEQDAWYRWRNRVLWTEPWSSLRSRWARSLAVVEDHLRALNTALSNVAKQEPDRFRERSGYLYRPRDGVAFHLPPGTLEQFYRRTVTHIRERLQLQPSADEADVLLRLIGEDGWREIYRQSMESSAERAVNELRQRIKTEVKSYLQEEIQGRSTLLPKLRDLLDQAAGLNTDRPKFDDVELNEFSSRLTGLIPANFTPQGSGPLKVLVSYPGGENQAIATYLRKSLQLPIGRDIAFEFSNTTAESISVVLFRSSMGITDVQEVRDVLRLWADAVHRPRQEDFLPWRQRTGYDFGYLATREEHRVRILHRLLCTMWNGYVEVLGDPSSPSQAKVTLSEVFMTLDLKALEDASSWGSLLQAYELWTLADNDQAERVFCTKLMEAVPHRLEEGGGPPSKLFELVVGMAQAQVATIDDMLPHISQGSRARATMLRRFWHETLPAAMEVKFQGSVPRENLRLLYESYRRRTGVVS